MATDKRAERFSTGWEGGLKRGGLLFGLAAAIPLLVIACASQEGLAKAAEPQAAETGAPPAPSAPRGAYFGAAAPGEKPEGFGPAAFLSGGLPFHGSPSFSPDGREAYWSLQRGSGFIMRFSTLGEGGWTEPAAPSFSRDGLGDDCPFLSPDGKSLFFVSQRPQGGGSAPGREGIWFVERDAALAGAAWSEPRPVSAPVNALPDIHWQISVDGRRDLYFTSGMDAGPEPGDIYRATWNGAGWDGPERLGPGVNSPRHYDGCPNISPDGRRLLFVRLDPATGKCGLFASFRGPDGTWSEAASLDARLPPIGLPFCPLASPDGARLFWLDTPRGSHEPFWADAAFLAGLDPFGGGGQPPPESPAPPRP